MRLLLFLALCSAACKSKDSAPAGRAAEPAAPVASAVRPPWPAGSARAAELSITTAFYFTDAYKGDPLAPLAGACEAQTARLDALGTRKVDRPALTDFAPPKPELLATFGRGLSDEQKKAVQHGPDPLRIVFTGPATTPQKTLRAMVELVDCYTRVTGAFYWDEDTRELYTGAEHRKHRLEPWAAAAQPDLSRHFTVHSYADGELLRQVSLGLGKVGLPDLVINGVAPNLGQGTGMLINLTACALGEGAVIGKGGELVLDVHKLTLPRWRELAKIVDDKKAPGKTLLRLRVGERDEGDAPNRLLEISFDEPKAASPTEQQGVVLDHLLGPAPDGVDQEDHDDEVLAAMAKARAELKKLKPRWDKGLKFGQSLMVKAPFRMDEDAGNEWMWFHVTEWKGNRIKGTLDNSPEHIARLKLGAIVDAPLDEIGDYALLEGEKPIEGYVLTKILLKRHNRPTPGASD